MLAAESTRRVLDRRELAARNDQNPQLFRRGQDIGQVVLHLVGVRVDGLDGAAQNRVEIGNCLLHNMATTLHVLSALQLSRQRRGGALRKQEIQAEQRVKHEPITENHLTYSSRLGLRLTVLVALARLAVLHLRADRQQRAARVLRNHRQLFFGTALLHTLHAHVILVKHRIAQEQRICWLRRDG